MTRRLLGRVAGLAVSLPVAASVALVATAAPAYADEASYLRKLNESGVSIPQPDHIRLSTGHYICGQLRVFTPGYDVRRALTETFFYSPEAAQTELAAAQSELCPETLGHPVPDLPA